MTSPSLLNALRLRIITSELKVVTSEKIGWSGVASTLVTWYGGVVMGVLLSFNEAAILYRDFNSAPSQKQNIIVFAANNSMCCQCHVAPTTIFSCNMQSAPTVCADVYSARTSRGYQNRKCTAPSQFGIVPVSVRVGNGISFRKNSAE